MKTDTDYSSDHEDPILDYGHGDWPQEPEYSSALHALLGILLVLVLGSGGFIAWRFLVPVDHRARALDFLAAQDYTSAIINLKHVVRESPQDAEMRWLMGNAYLQSGQPIEAADYLQEAFDLGHRNPEIAALLATAYARLGDTRRAETYQSIALKLESDTTGTRVALDSLNRGAADEAIDEHEQLVSHSPETVESRVMMAVSQLRAGQLVKALAISTALLHEAPQDPQVQYLHGSALELSGDPASAATYYERALELDPNYSAAGLALARIEWAGGRRKDAR